MSTAQEVIESRESTHGDYTAQANFSAYMKEEARKMPKWQNLHGPQAESIDMIIVKISRILTGDPNEPDHWQDIAGYATLVSNLLTKGTHL